MFESKEKKQEKIDTKKAMELMNEHKHLIIYEANASMLMTTVSMAKMVVEDLLNEMLEKGHLDTKLYNEYRDFALKFYDPDKAIDIIDGILKGRK